MVIIFQDNGIWKLSKTLWQNIILGIIIEARHDKLSRADSSKNEQHEAVSQRQLFFTPSNIEFFIIPFKMQN